MAEEVLRTEEGVIILSHRFGIVEPCDPLYLSNALVVPTEASFASHILARSIV